LIGCSMRVSVNRAQYSEALRGDWQLMFAQCG
jgi:hypothetical protein